MSAIDWHDWRDVLAIEVFVVVCALIWAVERYR